MRDLGKVAGCATTLGPPAVSVRDLGKVAGLTLVTTLPKENCGRGERRHSETHHMAVIRNVLLLPSITRLPDITKKN